jgi:hypothetical protein
LDTLRIAALLKETSNTPPLLGKGKLHGRLHEMAEDSIPVVCRAASISMNSYSVSILFGDRCLFRGIFAFH